MEKYHNPVLLKDCIDGLNIDPKGVYVDVTFGGGGHSKEILKNLTTGKLFAFDQDKDAQANKIDDPRFVLIPQNFKNLKAALAAEGVYQADGILADLGVSSHQFDVPERGFSTRFNSELDMRMDQNTKLTAATVLNTYDEDKLMKIFKEYGEVENAHKLSRNIFSKRKESPINTTSDLKEALKGCIKWGKENQYMAQVFQALRIEVNKEIDVLKDFLNQTLEVLKPGGRLVVISYHSLEDRLVKNFIRSGKFEGDAEKDFYGNQITPLKSITKKPIMPSEEELKINTRSRSARLRIAERNT